MSSVEAAASPVKLVDFVTAVLAEAQAASVLEKQRLLQQYVDDCVAEQLGRERGQPKPVGQFTSAWSCSRCGSPRSADFNYAGSYRRTVVFDDGSVGLRIPRVRCRCGGNVAPDFGAVLPKRQRLWYDVTRTALALHVEGLSYRAVGRWLGRQGVPVGLASLAGCLPDFAGVDIAAGASAGGVQALSLDAAFCRLGPQSRAQLYAHEVLARDQPLVRQGEPVAWHRTGKVLCCPVVGEESQAGWEAALHELIAAGLVDDQRPVWATSDGHRGLLAAADLYLPWAVKQRCVWHIAHRTHAQVSRGHEQRFERDTWWVFNAPDVPTAADRLLSLVQRWQGDEPEAVQSVLAKFASGVQSLRRDLPGQVRPRTVGISERYNQEPKRRFKAMRGFSNEQNLIAMTRLIALRHNCLIDRTDWLAHALNSTWTTPLPAAAARQQQRPLRPPYTTEGT